MVRSAIGVRIGRRVLTLTCPLSLREALSLSPAPSPKCDLRCGGVAGPHTTRSTNGTRSLQGRVQVRAAIPFANVRWSSMPRRCVPVIVSVICLVCSVLWRTVRFPLGIGRGDRVRLVVLLKIRDYRRRRARFAGEPGPGARALRCATKIMMIFSTAGHGDWGLLLRSSSLRNEKDIAGTSPSSTGWTGASRFRLRRSVRPLPLTGHGLRSSQCM